MRKEKILKRDFDAAVKVPWSIRTCLIAQAARRVFGRRWNHGLEGMYRLAPPDTEASKAMFDFDTFRRHKNTAGLKKLRASLPIAVNLP